MSEYGDDPFVPEKTDSFVPEEEHNVKLSDLMSKSEDTPTIFEEKDEYTVIIDIGQGDTKIGFAGDTDPKIFPTVVGKPRYKQMAGGTAQEIYVGNDTTRMRGVLTLEYPISRGNVMDWNHYYAILNHIFYDVLRVPTNKCNVIYIVPPLTQMDRITYFARVLFETHQVKSVVVVDSALSSAFSVGETTSLCVEIGDGLTTITPILNGKIYQPGIIRMNLAGSDIMNYLQSLLSSYGVMQKPAIIKEIKEQSCKIGLHAETAATDPINAATYILPDGEKLPISEYVATWTGEILFNPGLLGQAQTQGVGQAVIQSIQTTDPGYWKLLLEKIVLSGGTTLFAGFAERLMLELNNLLVSLGPLPEARPPPQYTPATPLASPSPITPVAAGGLSTLADQPVKSQGMVQSGSNPVVHENCPKCGEILDDKSSEFCPKCGENLKTTQIEIKGIDKIKYPTKCEKCGGNMDGKSKFCPMCGSALNPIITTDSLGRKDKKTLKKTDVDAEDLFKIGTQVKSEYGGMDKLDQAMAVLDKIGGATEAQSMGSGSVKIITSPSQKYASFKGASILANMPQFKKFLVDNAKFQVNPNSVYIDLSEIMKNL